MINSRRGFLASLLGSVVAGPQLIEEVIKGRPKLFERKDIFYTLLKQNQKEIIYTHDMRILIS